MPIANVLVGLALVVAGRRLFWLFVAAVGFVAGLEIATPVAETQPTAAALLVALLGGAIGAALALFLQPVAVTVAGFAAGALLVESAGGGSWHGPVAAWLPLVVGGLVGAIVMIAVFDWALVILSSLVGAELVATALPFAPSMRAVAFAALLVVGLAVQTRIAPRVALP
jgi:hypothetical protein